METPYEFSIDSELNFENHISNICSKVSSKLSTLSRVADILLLKNAGCCSRDLLNLNLIMPINLNAAFTNHE